MRRVRRQGRGWKQGRSRGRDLRLVKGRSAASPLLTLVKVPEFVGLSDVWVRLIELGADRSEEFHGETAAMVAKQTRSAVRLCRV